MTMENRWQQALAPYLPQPWMRELAGLEGPKPPLAGKSAAYMQPKRIGGAVSSGL